MPLFYIYDNNSKRRMRKFYIHDNGGRPFCVCVNQHDLTVYANTSKNDSVTYSKVVYETECVKLFVGDDPFHLSSHWESSFKGNTILAHIKEDLYVWIGSIIYEFRTAPGDYIIQFHSPVGNSDVPYPYAIGKRFTYLLLEGKYMDNKHIEPKTDPYDVYYSPTRIQDKLNGTLFERGQSKLSNIQRQDLQSKLEDAKKITKSAKAIKKKIKVKRLNH